MPKRLRQQILARDGGICQRCGDNADQVDHIAGNGDDPANLRALCKRCNWMRAISPSQGDGAEAEQAVPAFLSVMHELVPRVAIERPLKTCDDYRVWQRIELATRSSRREASRERQDEDDSDFEDVDGYLASAMAKDD